MYEARVTELGITLPGPFATARPARRGGRARRHRSHLGVSPSRTRRRAARDRTLGRRPHGRRRSRVCRAVRSNALSVLRAALGSLDAIERTLDDDRLRRLRPELRRPAHGRRRRQPCARVDLRRRRTPLAISDRRGRAAARRARSRSSSPSRCAATPGHDRTRDRSPTSRSSPSRALASSAAGCRACSSGSSCSALGIALTLKAGSASARTTCCTRGSPT